MNKLAFKILASQKNKKISGGFTLVELIVAAAISSIVLLIGGGALAYINQNNKVAKSETDRRAELNRALDFMADEIRQAQPTSSVTAIATNASTNLTTVAPAFGSTTGKTPVLRLQIPGATQPVVYYVAAKPTGSAWFGPNIVYRWGPTMNSSGAYTDLSTPANWQHKPLVDSIVSTSATVSCPSGWTANPSSGATGFYACIDSTGKIASLNLRGTQTDAYSSSLTPYEVSSKAFARPELTAVASPSPSTPSFTVNNGTVTVNQGSSATFQVLGGDIRCSGGQAIPTRATIKVSGQTDTVINNTNPASPPAAVSLPPLTAGTTVTVEAQIIPGSSQNSCSLSTATRSSANSQNTLGSWVYALKNGQDAPNRTAFGGGTSMDAILGPYIDTTNRKIKGLADNQVIYLFELYTNNTSSSAYDLQDVVVLATISPTN
ncbi:MAG: prepilin-type N-terminal cleavage/methylation domain-containing protein [Cyanosarcina radialis HA8281-LM2]|jgi:prepilin-type N-terminal cleavage/methylation domain-containing protein|nr:prepilin-type N-terminal cleavage/methylation domain-containing protein [Cyanosarcina radialis HA8281-LM2]